MGYVIGFLMLCFLIFVHELGHFIFARLFKMPVKSFAIGFGPAIFKRQKNGISYRFNLIPLGGYVAIDGESDEKVQNGFLNQPAYKRFWVLSAGILFNFLTAFLILVILFSIWGSPHRGVEIQSVLPESYAYEYLQQGDVIISVNGNKVDESNISEVPTYIAQSQNDIVNIEIKRGQETLYYDIPLFEHDDRKVLGISYAPAIVFYKDGNFLTEIFVKPIKETVYFMDVVIDSLKMLVTGEVSVKDLQGPVGIVDTTNTIYQISIPLLLWWMALISVNLGIMNSLPIPALDGGQILFLIVEKVVGRGNWNKKVATVINGICFAFLIALMLFVTYSDIVRLIHKP